MKLQKQKVDQYKGKAYYKHWIVIPNSTIKQLGWKEGAELKDEVKSDTLIVKPLNKNDLERELEEGTLYKEFKDSIATLLKRYPEGLSWSEIKSKLNFPQTAPNNKWVKKLEEDIGLVRIQAGTSHIWKLENIFIYTIGYEGLPIEEFISSLMENNIEQLIDVREIALSRKNGYSKGFLSSYLKQAGIRYQHISALGSPKDIRHQLRKDWDYETFFAEYKKHINDKDVLAALKDVEGLSKVRKTVLMCYEKNFKKCHRSIIAEILTQRGWKIKELRD